MDYLLNINCVEHRVWARSGHDWHVADLERETGEVIVSTEMGHTIGVGQWVDGAIRGVDCSDEVLVSLQEALSDALSGAKGARKITIGGNVAKAGYTAQSAAAAGLSLGVL